MDIMVEPGWVRRTTIRPRRTGDGRMLLLAGVVGLAGVYQLYSISRSYVLPTLTELWKIRRLPAWQRAAVLEQGEDFAGYVAFLRSQIPEDGRVILPPFFPEGPFSNPGYMQYFLFPRDIHNCGFDEVEACILRVVGGNTFILGLPGFPPRELAERSKRYVHYRDDFGLFVPK